ncbi:MAG TPA: class I adenylate-forming enzyme family protein, partial [Quisquiliibacterium sp.]|nr:class I adenylate-forming enzyme family protein [Quisquiliibacterium sp.]
MPALADRHVQPFAAQDIRTLLELQAQLRRDHPFLVWQPFSGPGRTWTYGQFVERLRRFAAGMHGRGVRAGDRVLVHLDNCPETVIAWFGCAWLGAVAVTTNAKSSADELAYFAGHSRAVAGITQPKFAQLVASACRGLRWLAVTETDNGDDAGSSRPEPSQSFERIDGDP